MNSATLQAFKLKFNPFAVSNQGRPTSAAAPLEEPVGPPPEPAPPQFTAHFIKRVCFIGLIFVAVLFSVFREIQHNRELYHMSQLVSSSDARAREWQERCRLEEAHAAALEAELQSLIAPSQTIQVTKADYRFPN